MITQWGLRNFKGVKEARLALRPLTILSGENSSGKSTVLQSMALVAQTLAAHLERDVLVLNGHLVSLGAFADIVPKDRPSEPLTISWTMEPQEPSDPIEEIDVASPVYETRSSTGLREIACQVSVKGVPATDTDGKHGNAQRPQVVQGTLQSVSDRDGTTSKISWADNASGSADAVVDDVGAKEVEQSLPQSTISGCELRHFLPSRLLLDVDIQLQNAILCVEAVCQKRRFYKPARVPVLRQAAPQAFVARLRALLSEASSEIASRDNWSFAALADEIASHSSANPNLRETLISAASDLVALLHPSNAGVLTRQSAHLPGCLPDAVSHIESFFATRFRYLGPLRDEPKSVYPYPTKVDPVELGRRGEFTAAAYHAYRDVMVDHVDVAAEPTLGPLGPVKRVRLKEAVDAWLHYLGVATHLKSIEEKYGHILGVSTPGGEFEMVHVGTGVSQVLPIIVMGLLAQPDDFIAVEHPELHLHPAVQTKLADFFLFLAATGRQAVVETHSEHIVNRVRSRTARDDSGVINGMVAVYFATVANGAASFEAIAIDEYGAVKNWPKGFFDEAATEAEAIIRAAIDRRKSEEG